jgi:hypothetical protein
MRYQKPFLPILQQMAQLEARGLEIVIANLLRVPLSKSVITG